MAFTTIDGRNPAPVDRWFISLLIGFQVSTIQSGAGFFASTVCLHSINVTSLSGVEPYLDPQIPTFSVKTAIKNGGWTPMFGVNEGLHEPPNHQKYASFFITMDGFTPKQTCLFYLVHLPKLDQGASISHVCWFRNPSRREAHPRISTITMFSHWPAIKTPKTEKQCGNFGG